ncbi:MAG: fibronectin type III domain-containing protein, partial [Bacteroidaceae bacterium]|nr:fibronectin type III domain-containing protein [Bacteroidaceae bacterium]
RDLASMFLTNLTTDLKKYGWKVRQLWNRNYGEARAPLTPACILEMLSHQNFADMRMAYDPHFKFDFSRSVYKTIVKYLSTLYKRDYVIQPLPVENFAITLNEQKQTATLTWSAVNDPLEPTAKPKEYIVYTRRGYQGFDNGTIVKGTSHTMTLFPDEVYSFKIAALNEGGESFPSEVLSCGIATKNKGTILVVNAFTRLEGPKAIDTPYEAGFDLDADPGVPYGAYTSFCGRQRSFDRSKAGSEASDGLGASGAELEGQLMMGNTFDYAVIHGRAIMLTGQHSFTSCSEQALLTGRTTLNDYPIADLIYGTQKQFNSQTNRMVEQYYNQGGKLLLSAANTGGPSIGGSVMTQLPPTNIQLSTITGCGLTFDIYRKMNPESYCVPAPSVLTPAGKAFAILTYADGSYAAIAEPHRFVRLGFPLESIKEHNKLNALTRAFITFLE